MSAGGGAGAVLFADAVWVGCALCRALPSALSATGVWWLTLGVVVGNVLLFLHWYWMWRRLIAMEHSWVNRVL